MLLRDLKYALPILFWLAAPSLSASESIDDSIYQQSQNPETTLQGQVLFEQICASCHGKDLSGGSGFNLKDGEWVHGKRPSQILDNVKNGFMSAGMPGFGAVFSEPQLQSIVAYIVSKQEGWSNLTFKLYQLNSPDDTEITEEKLVKTGALPKGLADYSIPEIQHYYIEFEGDFYAPKDIDTQIWLEWGFPHEVFMYVDGELVKRGGKPWYPTWRLKRGKQKLRITYRSGTNKPHQRNLVLLGTTLDMKIKLFAVSSRAQKILSGKKFEIKTAGKTLVQRKRVHELPPFSISVGLPSKINYAFNTRSCSIVGVWQGELLNIGPNIAGRGEDPSLPLGDWLFKYPQRLSPNSELICKFKGYHLVDGEPRFDYQIGDSEYSLMAVSHSAKDIQFEVTTNNQHVSWFLPENKKVAWTVNGRAVSARQTTNNPNNPDSSDNPDNTALSIKLSAID